MKELTVTSLFIIVSLSSTFANVLKYVPIAKSGKWPPKFCNKLDCPRYTVLETHKEYELRQYSASSWMSTNTAGVDYSKASSTNFMRLFRYISGTNADMCAIDRGTIESPDSCEQHLQTTDPSNKMLSPYTFEICDTTGEEFAPYKHGGIDGQVKVSHNALFLSRHYTLLNKYIC
uniref:Uncharacterized protein n=1 Tax=Magallana gigas TaxID=29159 RepID=K1Q7M7_MAGGI